MSGSQTLARQVLSAVKRAGADVVFGLPGVHNLAFWRGAPSVDAPRIVTVRHEQTCVYAADGWARATGRLGVGLVTTGPGAANAVAAFGEAAASRSPVLLVASEVPQRVIRSGVTGALHQSADQARMFQSLAKATFVPRTVSEAVDAVAAAIVIATRSPRGPVYVDIPADVLDEMAGAIAVDPAAVDPAAVDPAAVDALGIDQLGADGLRHTVNLLRGAENIAIWAGGGVVEAAASAMVADLAGRLHAPVFTTFASRGALPRGHPCVVGLPPHEPEVEQLLASADVLVGIGTQFDGMNTKNGSLRFPDAVVAIDLAPNVSNVSGSKTTPVIAEAGQALEQLLATCEPRSTGLADRIPALRETVWSDIRSDHRTAEAARFVDTVDRVTLGTIPVICDMTIPGYWLAGYFEPDRPRLLQYPMGWGTLGYALPASIGAAEGTGGPVLVVCGDGGIMFALGELATIAEQALPVVVTVVVDGGYGMLRFDQDRAGDEHRGVDLFTPDFVRIAEAFGIAAESVTGTGEALAGALHRALDAGTPRLVVCEARLYPPRTTSPRWHEAG